MTLPHAPKLSALSMLESGRLSSAGRTRLEAHLRKCPVCAEAQRGLRIHDALRAELRATSVRLDYARIERALHGEAASAARSARLRRHARLAWPLLAAAAAGLALIGPFTRPSPHAPTETPANMRSQRPARAVSDAELTPPSALVVDLLGAALHVPASSDSEPLALGALLGTGDELRMDAASEATVEIASGIAFVLTEESLLTLASLEPGRTSLLLSHGRVRSRVRALEQHESYEITAAGYTVSVVGTRFEVATDGIDLDVFVHEGVVAIRDASGTVLRTLSAGGFFHTAAAPSTAAATPEASPARASVRASPWVQPAQLRQVLEGERAELQRCYERALKRRPDLGGRIDLRITLDGHGRVTSVRARAQGQALPTDLAHCLRERAMSLRFPAPGPAGLVFDAPLRLTPE